MEEATPLLRYPRASGEGRANTAQALPALHAYVLTLIAPHCVEFFYRANS
jgi:hypothetical protein